MDSKNPASDSLTAPDLDLFGQPIRPIKDRRGRPSYGKVAENQQTVAVLRARGWTHERIARYLGYDEKTLRKHFSRELPAGADIVEGQCLEVLFTRMRQGHTPSAKGWRSILGTWFTVNTGDIVYSFSGVIQPSIPILQAYATMIN
ncbi:MAG: hypothetical protein NXI27_02020 [Alphaproteobacteria bacterium]|nr:hypothetical protein [Alphaproteobacteria bacterium]